MNLLKRLWYWLLVRDLEVKLDELQRDMQATMRPEIFRILMAHRELMLAQLAVVRGHYCATFPPGSRKTWREA